MSGETNNPGYPDANGNNDVTEAFVAESLKNLRDPAVVAAELGRLDDLIEAATKVSPGDSGT